MSYYEVKCVWPDCKKTFSLDTDDYKIFETVIGQVAPNPFDNLIELGRLCIDSIKKLSDKYSGKEIAKGRIGSEKNGKTYKKKIFYICPYCKRELTTTIEQYEEL
jgi:hypothetical protein